MVLRMARPTKNKKTGIYQFRRRVPDDVRLLIGGPKIVKRSLGSKDPDEAERLFKEVDRERGGPRSGRAHDA